MNTDRVEVYASSVTRISVRTYTCESHVTMDLPLELFYFFSCANNLEKMYVYATCPSLALTENFFHATGPDSFEFS